MTSHSARKIPERGQGLKTTGSGICDSSPLISRFLLFCRSAVWAPSCSASNTSNSFLPQGLCTCSVWRALPLELPVAPFLLSCHLRETFPNHLVKYPFCLSITSIPTPCFISFIAQIIICVSHNYLSTCLQTVSSDQNVSSRGQGPALLVHRCVP